MAQQPPEDNAPQAGWLPPPPPTPPPGAVAGAPPGTYAPTGTPTSGAGPRTDGFAIASLCCSFGIFVICWLGIVTSILAIVFAKKAERNIAASGGTVAGAGLAKAGKIVGWVGIGIWVLVTVAYAVIIVAAITGSDTSNSLGVLH